MSIIFSFKSHIKKFNLTSHSSNLSCGCCFVCVCGLGTNNRIILYICVSSGTSWYFSAFEKEVCMKERQDIAIASQSPQTLKLVIIGGLSPRWWKLDWRTPTHQDSNVPHWEITRHLMWIFHRPLYVCMSVYVCAQTDIMGAVNPTDSLCKF